MRTWEGVETDEETCSQTDSLEQSHEGTEGVQCKDRQKGREAQYRKKRRGWEGEKERADVVEILLYGVHTWHIGVGR